MKRIPILFAALLSACSAGPEVAPADPPKPAPKPAPPADPPKPRVSLSNPDDPAFAEKAPAQFTARFETSKGTFDIRVTRAWAPRGADRFYTLVKNGYYDGCRFFRVIAGFMAQFGINGDPGVSKAWRTANIKDDPVKESNTRGTISFAMAGPDTRTTQLFINFGDNARLDNHGFSPFGRVIEGMEVVDRLHSGYGEGAPGGRGPSQGLIQTRGNDYLESDFPKLDFIKKATVTK